MVDKSELAIATSQPQIPIPVYVELLFNLLSQIITISTIKRNLSHREQKMSLIESITVKNLDPTKEQLQG